MRQQHATGGLGDEMLGHAAEDQFAESRMTVGAGDNQPGADIGGDAVEPGGGVTVRIPLRDEFESGNAMARQPCRDIAHPRFGNRPAVLVLGDFSDG